jgi:hypothetical protein
MDLLANCVETAQLLQNGIMRNYDPIQNELAENSTFRESAFQAPSRQ